MTNMTPFEEGREKFKLRCIDLVSPNDVVAAVDRDPLIAGLGNRYLHAGCGLSYRGVIVIDRITQA